MRSRTLGAFSVLIPIVNFWWPYEALRDSYPPGSNHDLLMRWWISYLGSAFAAGIIAFVSALVGKTAVVSIGLVIAACLLAVAVFLGWKVIDEVEAMQRAAS